ncbi:MAG: radical SAM protein [Clostridia bacterium]
MEKAKNKQNKTLQKMLLKKSINLNIKKEIKNITNKTKQYTIPIFIPHRGCKNECVFCNQKKISGELKVITPEQVDKLIQEKLAQFDKNSKKIEVAFFGGSFTGLNIEEQIEYLKVAKKYVDMKKIKSIRISTRPDYITNPILKILKEYHVKNIELGVQSMDNDVLNNSKRGHSKEDVIIASKLIKKFGFQLGIQIMVGLPTSTEKIEVETIRQVLELKPKELRIYPVYVIYPSELYNMYLEKKYIPLEFDDAVKRTALIIKECTKTNVAIIRVGLQSTDEIAKSNKQIRGPVCDNFAEYAFAKLILEKLDKKIAKLKIINKNKSDFELQIKCKSRYISLVVGPKKVNKDYLEKKYNIQIKVKGD